MTIRLHRHADLRLTALEGEGVALHMGSRRYFTVTETGLSILEALKEPRTFDELVDAITAEYEVEREHATRSVRQFVDSCKTSALILEHDA
jgi:hypothetical protein